jgi:diaminopimelate decarboxylase/aspartate kinase
VRVIGLHAHTGSGIFDVANWTETGELLADLAQRFPDVSVVDLGGGIGVPEQLGMSESTSRRWIAALPS